MIDSKKEFTAIVEEAGIPTTDAGLKAKWENEVAAQGSSINNDSDYSPFWRLVSALITIPVQWLVALLINQVLPNSYVKTASGVFLDMLAWAVNVTRKLAVKAVGNIEFTRLDASGELQIPIGAVVQSVEINGKVYRVVTTEAVTMTDGALSVGVPVEAVDTGDGYNLSAGYYSILVEPIPGVTGVSNLADWLTVPGVKEELDDDLRDRVRNQFSAVNQWHTDAVYKAIISSFDGVKTKNIFFQHDAPRGPGTANAFLMLDIGTPAPSFIAEIQSEITDNGNHGHGDDLQLFAIPETTHPVTASIWGVSNLSAEKTQLLKNNVENFIRSAFRENTDYPATLVAPLSRFSFSQLGRELHKNFPDLLSIEFATSDIISLIDKPVLGVLTVTV
ncbi:MAG: baseplate J/gp47 family protein [Gammaproteobacteria bacterium]|nr:baseplate J/gp47 family protein [Gammaproteobacteria bacterium]